MQCKGQVIKSGMQMHKAYIHGMDGRHGLHFFINLSWSCARAQGHELGNQGVGNSTVKDAWALPRFSTLSILLSVASSGQERK